MDPRHGNSIGGPVNTALLPSIDLWAYYDDMASAVGISGLPAWIKSGSHPLLRFGGPKFGGSISNINIPGGGLTNPK